MKSWKPATPLTEDSLKALNRKVTSQSNKLHSVLERQVDKYFNSLDSEVRKQLSRSQLIRSREKTYLWHRANNKYINVNETIPEDYLKSDYDPGAYNSKTYNKPSSNSRHPAFAKILTGKQFEEEREKECPTKANQKDIDVERVVPMSSWISKRRYLSNIASDLHNKIASMPEQERESTYSRYALIHNSNPTLLKKLVESNEVVRYTFTMNNGRTLTF